MIFFGCNLGGNDISIDSDEAKSLYLAASEALYDEVDPLGENSEKGFSSKETTTVPIDHVLPPRSANGVTLSGTVTGTISSDMPTNLSEGTFTNSVNITMDIEGTMDEVEVPDPDDPSTTYKISGTLEHYMSMVMNMTMTIAADSLTITPGGTLDLEIRHSSTFTVIKSDGSQISFELVFNDKPAQINLGNLGPGSGGQMPNGADAYQKTAKLYTYDKNGNLLTEADVSIMDVPWMMGNLMGGGGTQGGGEEPPPPPPPPQS